MKGASQCKRTTRAAAVLKKHNDKFHAAYDRRYKITAKNRRDSDARLIKDKRSLKSGGQRWAFKRRRAYATASEAKRAEARLTKNNLKSPWRIPKWVKLQLSAANEFTSLVARANLQIELEDNQTRAKGIRPKGGHLLVVRAPSGGQAHDVFSKYFVRREILDHLVKEQPQYAAALKLCRCFKKDRYGTIKLVWESPSIVSPVDATIQKLVADHTEVALTGRLKGYSDYYLHSFLEFDTNQDVMCAKQLLRSAAAA
mmetsp:Transcript_6946/g.22079  ORF Transcript_6946/g.22079 Transcript_6946/m.22079 type:complete len:256 (+) Transcript_6946:194-961(+)